MKKILFFLTVIGFPAVAKGQTVTNAENFQVGTVIQFQNCAASGINPGNQGTGQTWNFASLTALPDTLTQTIMLPAATPYAGSFPNANLVEKYSDGRYIYLNKTSTENNIIGIIDPASNFSADYQYPLQLIKRPLVYGSTFSSIYSTNYTAAGFNFRGKGTSSISVDGSGTLILPNRIVNNVLRVKIEFVQTDTLLQFGTVSTTTNIAYAWYDGIHAAALLQMESTTSGSFYREYVRYLISENSAITGIAKPDNTIGFEVFPNPAGNHFVFSSPQKGALYLINQLGQIVKTIPVTDHRIRIETDSLAPGLYQAFFRSEELTYKTKLLVKQ